MKNYLILEQTHVLSQNQIQSLEILAMDSVTLDEYLNNEYLENPVLDKNHVSDTTIASAEESIDQKEKSVNAAAVYDGHVSNDEEHSYQIPDEKQQDIMDLLLGQIVESRYSSGERELIKFMIDSLDESGFYDMTAEETAAVFGTDTATVRKCLRDLKSMEPCGIFSSGLEECLARQLDHAGELDENLACILHEHLEDVASGHIKNITRSLQISTAEARRYIELIKRMNPRPLSGYMRTRVEYVVPDLLVEKGGDGWNIVLNDKWVENYRISDFYRKMMEETADEELKAYFHGKMERARLLLRSIEQRRQTLQRIVGAIISFQPAYFEEGASLQPLTMQEVADRIDMHLSTVSRGVKGKYLQSKWGTVALKDFFVQSVNHEEGDKAVSPEAVKKQIRRIIDEENKNSPYSDSKIAALLEEEGIAISRRTVAKYRELMYIPGIFERKI